MKEGNSVVLGSGSGPEAPASGWLDESSCPIGAGILGEVDDDDVELDLECPPNPSPQATFRNPQVELAPLPLSPLEFVVGGVPPREEVEDKDKGIGKEEMEDTEGIDIEGMLGAVRFERPKV